MTRRCTAYRSIMADSAKPAQMAHTTSTHPVFYALGANLAVAIAKLVGWGMTGSGAMLAEGLHSIADTGNQGLLLLGLHQGKKPPSVRHPLGQGRAIHFWSLTVDGLNSNGGSSRRTWARRPGIASPTSEPGECHSHQGNCIFGTQAECAA